ncbi:MAG: hypothetical protein ACI89L_001829 [Phycisphaerales bacterium]|jgi:hypothetical protein
MELTGTERTLALLEAERGGMFAAGWLFVSGSLLLSVLMYSGLLMATLSLRTALEMTAVAVLWCVLMLGLWAGLRAHFAWCRRWLLKRRVLLPATVACEQGRNMRIGSVAALAALFIFGPLSLQFASGGWDRLLRNALMFAPAYGYALMFLGLFGMRGREPRCATCAYDVGDDPDAWVTCPECGRDLAEPFGVVLGNRTRRGWLVALGVALVWAAHLGVVLL